MAVNKTPIASDSAAELHHLIGDDASATFESDPKFVDSNPTGSASSEHLTLRDTDDTEDSEEEEVEEEEDEEEEDDEDEDEDEDIDEEDEDEDGDLEDEEDDDADEVLKAAEPVNVHGAGKRSRKDVEDELNEMEDESTEDVTSTPEEAEEREEEELQKDRAIDEALRISANEIAGQGY